MRAAVRDRCRVDGLGIAGCGTTNPEDWPDRPDLVAKGAERGSRDVDALDGDVLLRTAHQQTNALGRNAT